MVVPSDTVWSEKEIVSNEIDSSQDMHHGGPYCISQSTRVQLLQDDGMTWGMRLLDTGREDGNVIQFREPVPNDDTQELSYETKKLHVVLGGDIEFLNTVLGMQSCSASFPCNLCLIALATLKERLKDMESADPRSASQHKQKLEKVLEGATVKLQKELAKTNHSVIREPLIPADTDRVLLAVLHIILGVTKKIWDILVLAVQKVDDDEDKGQRKLLTEVRNILIAEADRLDAEQEASRAQFVEAEKNKSDAWKLLSDERMKEPYNTAEVTRLAMIHKEACKALKERKKEHKEIDKTAHSSVLSAVKEINTYLKGCRGKFESILEKVIGLTPILARHNPFYSGSFNGNDCFRLMQNYLVLFQKLREGAEDEDKGVRKKIEDISDGLEEVFAAWAEVLPLLRKVEKLEPNERATLLDSIDEFWDAYVDKSDGSITIKIHMLRDHVKKQLNAYGTIGLFVEDSVESIHAIVNILARRYAALDPERRSTQVMRALAMRNQMSLSKLSRMKEAGIDISKKRKRKQGERTVENIEEVYAAALDPAVASAAKSFLNVVQSPDAEPSEYFSKVSCAYCRDYLGEDVNVPSAYWPLHQQLCHEDVGDKFVSGKKQKRE